MAEHNLKNPEICLFPRRVFMSLAGACLSFCLFIAPARADAEFTGDPILRVETGGHTAAVRRISVDREERFLVSGSEDKTVRVHDMETGRLLKTLRIPVEEGGLVGKIFSVAISPDGKTVAVGGFTGKESGKHSIYLLDRQTGAMTARISGLPNVILHLAYSPDGRYLAAALRGANGVRVYETSGYKEIAGDKDYGDDSYWASFDASNRLITTSDDVHIRLYGPDFKLLKKDSAPGDKNPYSAVFSPDGSRIAVGYSHTARVDVLKAEDLSLDFSANTAGVNNRNLPTVAWSADGNALYAGGRYNRGGFFPILRWDKGGRGAAQEFNITTNTVMGIAPLSDGRIAVGFGESLVGVIGKDGKAIWKTQAEIADFRGQRGENGIHLSKSGDIVRFGFKEGGKEPARFSLADGELALDPQEDKELSGPVTESGGLNISGWINGLTPKLNGKGLELEKYEMSRSLAITPDGKNFVLGADWSLRCFDSQGKEIWKVPAPEVAWAVNISKDGQVAVVGYGDGTLRWHRMKDGIELLALFVHPDAKRWAIWTPKGYYKASAGGEDPIGWHFNNGADKAPDFFGASSFRDQFYRPDVIAHVLKTLDPDQALALADKAKGQETVAKSVRDMLPPTISILAPAPGAGQKETKLTMTYLAESEKGEILDIEAKVDGRPAKVLNHDPKYTKNRQVVAGHITIEIPPQNSSVGLIAKNQNGASEPAAFYVNWEGTPDWYKPNLYVLAVGVKEYEEKSYDGLHYPDKDAEDFVNAVKKQKGRLYKEVTTRLLRNGEAKREAILDGLDWLMRETTSHDVAMVFFSGHGIKNPGDGGYQFIPYDADLARLDRTTLDGHEFKKFLGKISGKAILFMDTCYSGKLFSDKKAGDSQPDMNLLANELAEAQSGVVIFASSTGKEESKEDEKGKNGFFTEALLEGMEKGEADLAQPPDGFVSIGEFYVFLPERVKKLSGSAQHPVTTIPGPLGDYKIISVVR